MSIPTRKIIVKKMAAKKLLSSKQKQRLEEAHEKWHER